MTTDRLSLKSLFLEGPEAPSVEGETALASVRKEIVTKVPSVSWSDASKQIDEKIDEILDQPIDGILVAAWSKYEALQRYTDTEKYPPGKTVLTSLVKHKIQSLFKPSVVIQVAGVDMASLEFPIALHLEIEGCTLKIEGGKIRAVLAGSLQGFGSLKFRLNILRPKLPGQDLRPPIERKSPKYVFPKAITLGEGVPIKPARGAAPRARDS